MKIFAISDTHGNLEGLDPSGSDVVVMAGDLALCGHIHSGDLNPILLSHADGNETVVRNVSRFDEEYKVRYEPFVFEV